MFRTGTASSRNCSKTRSVRIDILLFLSLSFAFGFSSKLDVYWSLNLSGGQAKTLMFVHISPEFDATGETISTLKFAERVSTVELGAARANKDSGDVKELKEQVLASIFRYTFSLLLFFFFRNSTSTFSSLFFDVLTLGFRRLLVSKPPWRGRRQTENTFSTLDPPARIDSERNPAVPPLRTLRGEASESSRVVGGNQWKTSLAFR